MESKSSSSSLKTPSFVLGLSVLLAWTLIALFAEQIAPHDPIKTVGAARQSPSFEFWFGTDRLGRDVLSRVIFGARISLLLGLISVAMGSVIGSVVGLVSGFYSGWVDTLAMRAMDAMLAFPGILLALVIIAALGPSIENVMIAVGISTVPRYARLIRATVLSLREQPYVDAARVLGVRDIKIMFRHVLPNTLAPLLVLFDPSGGQRHLGRSGIELFRDGGATADGGVGIDGGGRANGARQGVVDLDVSRVCHSNRRHGL